MPLKAIGYTEHAFAHMGRTAADACNLQLELGCEARTAELARIAGYMHDIGNVVNRVGQAQSGALMAFRILDKMGIARRRGGDGGIRHRFTTTKAPPFRSTP